MKKLLLLPLLVMSMLVGCNENGTSSKEEEKIYTPVEWLKNTDTFENELYYYVAGIGEEDYDNVIRDKMLQRFEFEFKFPHKIEKANANDLLTYRVKKNLEPYTECTFYFHETTVETRAIGRVKGQLVEQCAQYDCYSSYSIVSLLTFASNRLDETYKIKYEEIAAAKEFNTLENFYKGIEEATTNPIATFSNLTREDTNHALLDDFKDLLKSQKDTSFYYKDKNPFMTYGLNEDFMLRFYLDSKDEPVAILEYRYQSSLNFTGSTTRSFSVEREKIDNIIKKITGSAN